MNLNNSRLSIIVLLTLAISFEIILVIRIFCTGISANAQEISISVTPTMPAFTQMLTYSQEISNSLIITFPNVISTSTPTTGIVQITPTPTEILTEKTVSPTPTLTPTQYSPTETITPFDAIINITTTEEVHLSQSYIYTYVLTGFLQAYLPFVILDETQVPIETPQKVLFCDNANNSIPDDFSSGITRSISIEDNRYIVDIDVSLDITHAWVGDLIVSIEHQNSNQITTLIHQPGVPQTTLGCGQNDIKAIFDDELTDDAEHKCSSTAAAISGIYIPYTPLNRYHSELIHGKWIINVSDNSSGTTGKLNSWCVIASLTNYPQIPTPTPTPITLPKNASISVIFGEAQAFPLDCESRSAVDWAKFFGKTINEINFFNKLPHSDNPDKGFVGNVNGTWGKIPPNDYGVHAEPVAQVLRDYGLSAHAHRPLSWDALRSEISNNHPVIVWIVDSISNGIPIYYLPDDGLWTIVAKYEHTVIITGYTPTTVSYLNGDTITTKKVDQFLDSWSALENMAIVTYP